MRTQAYRNRRDRRRSLRLAEDIYIRLGALPPPAWLLRELKKAKNDTTELYVLHEMAGMDAASLHREEFAHCSDVTERNELEHPEQAYRRGYQQGAHAVANPLIKAGLLDPEIQRAVKQFVYHRIFDWRYAKQRRLGRHLNKDSAPELIKPPRKREER
jgi:hypothetical protein